MRARRAVVLRGVRAMSGCYQATWTVVGSPHGAWRAPDSRGRRTSGESRNGKSLGSEADAVEFCYDFIRRQWGACSTATCYPAVGGLGALAAQEVGEIRANASH